MFELYVMSCMLYFGIKTVLLNKKHLLMMLMGLELLSLLMILMILVNIKGYYLDLMIIMYMMIILVCEAVMGLVLLTLIVRSHGCDYLKSSSLFLC